jgi:hypothetical protein
MLIRFSADVEQCFERWLTCALTCICLKEVTSDPHTRSRTTLALRGYTGLPQY